VTERNLSPQKMFARLALEHKPLHAFDPAREAFAAWKARTYPKVLATTGDWPGKVEPHPELVAEWAQDGVVKQRWLLEVGPHASAVVLINRPADRRDGGKLPAILCWHGHGRFGKDPVMGNDATPERRAEIEQHHYNYGHRMAKAGYVTYAMDWMGMGERNDSGKPHFLSHNGGRDWCNLYYLHATMLGMTSLSINLAHGRALTDFVAGLPDVDAGRLGVMGLSGGGTMTLWTALTDPRMKAAEIICYSDLWACFGIRDLNYCGMQVAPGLFKLVDLPDLQGLLAPLPLLVDIGVYDTCFVVDNAMACFKKVEAIYRAAGAADRLELDLFPGEHGWGGGRSVPFFEKHLGARGAAGVR
jgi:dienelactone hydrolase